MFHLMHWMLNYRFHLIWMWLKLNESEAIHKRMSLKNVQSQNYVRRFVLRLFYIYSIYDKLESNFVVVQNKNLEHEVFNTVRDTRIYFGNNAKCFLSDVWVVVFFLFANCNYLKAICVVIRIYAN